VYPRLTSNGIRRLMPPSSVSSTTAVAPVPSPLIVTVGVTSYSPVQVTSINFTDPVVSSVAVTSAPTPGPSVDSAEIDWLNV